MCIILKSSVSGKDYITGQPTVQKLNKQVNTIKHIYNQFCDLPALQNLNIMKTVDTYIPLMEYTLQYVKYTVNFISLCWWEVPSYFPCDRTLLICSMLWWNNGKIFQLYKVVKSDWHSKLCEENIEALLHIKVDSPKVAEFIKEHSSDIVAF